MKLLLGIFALSLTAAATLSPAAWSKPAPATAPSASSNTPNPLMKGVNLTDEQRSKIGAIQNRTTTQAIALLTPAQKVVLQKDGPRAVQLTADQQTKYQQIITTANTEITAVLTPAQIQQIRSNIQSIQQQQSTGNNSQRR